MHKRTRDHSSVDTPFSGRTWSSRTLFAVSGTVCKAADLLILSSAAFFVLLVPHLRYSQAGAASSPVAYLEVRISIRNILVSLSCVMLWRLMLWVVGAYAPQRTRSFADYFFRCIIGLNACTLVVGLGMLVLRSRVDVWHVVEVFWAYCLLVMVLVRVVLLVYAAYLRPRLRPSRNLIIVGSGARARQVYRELKAHSGWEYSLLGFIDSDPQSGYVPAEMILGSVEELETILAHSVVDEVVIALPVRSQYEAVEYAIGVCQSLGIQAQYFTDFFSTSVTKHHSRAGPQSVVLEVTHDDYRQHVKRFIDVVLSSVLILVFLPVMVAVALAVKLTSRGPILFRQERFGLNKRRFYMLKFRSMILDAESRQGAIEHLNELAGPAFKIKNDPRLTPIGGTLRRLSLDELPQLFNVFTGQMSLVGPRPLPLRDVNRFSEARILRRFSVKPGITCLWQIMGRSNMDFDRWIALDLEYIDHWSLWLDCRILMKTIPAVVTSRGAS